jgi:hypothetical protein
VGPRAGVYDMEKRKFLTLPGLELRPLARPVLREEYLIEFCMRLIAVISHDNYYNQFCHSSCELVQ